MSSWEMRLPRAGPAPAFPVSAALRGEQPPALAPRAPFPLFQAVQLLVDLAHHTPRAAHLAPFLRPLIGPPPPSLLRCLVALSCIMHYSMM